MSNLDLIRTPEQAEAGAIIVRSAGSVPFPLLRLSKAHFLPQTRGNVTAGDVSGLWPGMVVSFEEDQHVVELIQPPTVGIFTQNAMQKYLQLLKEFWESDDSEIAMSPINHEDGQRYSAVIAGHRRFTAVPIAVEHATGNKHTPHDKIWVPVNTIPDPDYIHGLQTQYRENAHKQVPLWQEADVITRTRRWLSDKNNQMSFVELADYLGITPERVSNAVRFTALPRNIQDKVAHGILRSSDALELEIIGSALGYRLLKNNVRDDILTSLETRLRSNQLRLWDVMPLLVERQLEIQWNAMMKTELTRISGLSKEMVSKYSTGIREAQLSNQLFDSGALTDGDPRNLEEFQRVTLYKTSRRKDVAAHLLSSLRGLLAVLDEDMGMVRQASTVPDISLTPVLAASHRAGKIWSAIDRAVNGILEKRQPPDTSHIDALVLVADQLTKLINDLHAEDMLTKDSDDIRRALQSLELALVNNLVGTHDQIAPALSAIRGYIQIDQAAPEQSLFEPEGMFE